MEENSKPTRIIVLSDKTVFGETAEKHGVLLSEIFQSELEILYPKKDFFIDQIYHYAEESNAILIVISIPPDSYKKNSTSDLNPLFNKRRAIRFIRNSRAPILVVGNQNPAPNGYQQVVLPIDVDRQAKEKAMWASYFLRFHAKIGNIGTIHVIHNQHKEEIIQKKVKNNIAFIEKLYNNLEIDYKIYPLIEEIHIDQTSITFAAEVGATVTVIMMTRFYTIIDFLFGSKESKILGNELGFPILCINERNDLCVLCQ
jgi:hypothetical protein